MVSTRGKKEWAEPNAVAARPRENPRRERSGQNQTNELIEAVNFHVSTLSTWCGNIR